MWARASERDLDALVAGYAKAGGWLRYHTHDSRHSPAGFPDLVLVRPPEILFVELKRQKGKLSDEQRTWLRALEQCAYPDWLLTDKGMELLVPSNIEVHVWRPSDEAFFKARLLERPVQPHPPPEGSSSPLRSESPGPSTRSSDS